MRILYLAHRIPYPPDKGDKIRSYHQVQHLSKEHDVHLVCIADNLQDLNYKTHLEAICSSVCVVFERNLAMKARAFFALASQRPLSVCSYYSRAFQSHVDRIIESKNIDLIFMFSSVMAQYVQNIRRVPKIMDFVDVDSEKWRAYVDFHKFPLSWIYSLEAKRLSLYEAEVARMCEHSILVTEQEAQSLRERVGNVSISAIANGVDLKFFAHNELDEKLRHPPSIVFTGAMDYFPNIDAVQYFCHSILPLIKQTMPDIRFIIVGRNPPSKIKELSAQPGVIVSGSVPDIRPFLEKAWVSVAPLRIARGIQNKVLEAMAMGLPVVGTPQAFEGMKVGESDGIRIANNPEEFAVEIITLLGNGSVRQECSYQVRQYVERCHRWEDHGSELETLLLEVSNAFGCE